MRFGLGLRLALCLVVVGCANHRKQGDQAAAVGDWKSAEAYYRAAVRKAPDDKTLAEKYQHAKAEAFTQAKTRAARCIDEKSWDCAQQEADYASSLVETDAEAIALRKRARNGRAMHSLAQARAEVQTNSAHALDLVDFARGLSTDDEVQREAKSVQTAAVDSAIAQANTLRQQAGGGGPEGGNLLDSAIVILMRAAKADPRANQPLNEARADKERWIQVEYERLARMGDSFVAKHDWANATASYQAAERMRPNGRAVSGMRYVNLVSTADGATNARDFGAAADGYRQASSLPDDRDRYAAMQLDRVELRRYRLKLKSVIVKPTRPDGTPWVGRPSVQLAQMSQMMAQSFANGQPGNFHAVSRIPAENHPRVGLEVTLPDGRRYRSNDVQGVFVNFPIELVVDTNAYEDRKVEVRVVTPNPGKTGAGELEMDRFDIHIKDLVAGQRVVSGPTALRVELALDPAPSLAEGSVAGLNPMPNETNVGEALSLPQQGSTGWSLTAVDATLKTPGAVNPRVEILQNGKVVYRNPEVAAQTSTLAVAPKNVYLFVAPNESVVVRLLSGTTPTMEKTISASQLAQGSVALGAQNEPGWMKLTVTKRRSGP